MAYQATQESLSALAQNTAAAQSRQLAIVAIVQGTPRAVARQVCISCLYDLTPPVSALADMCTLEALVASTGPFRASMVVAEVLCDGDDAFSASKIFLEALFEFEQISPNVPTYEPMSDYLFPTLPGLQWDIVKAPKFSTQIAPHLSGREVRISSYAYPVWTWEMSYEFLRAGAEEELQTLMGFFLKRSGSFDTFLYQDPDETNIMTAVALGTGDATQSKWTLSKTYAGFTEPCGYVDPASIRVYFNAVEQTSGWSFISPNQISFTTPPSIGVTITASYTWYYRVRFGEDRQDYNQFMFELWELKKVTLQSVKP